MPLLPDLPDEEWNEASSALPDTTLPAPAPAPRLHLLPDNMSFAERGLWGENGFFRNVGIASPLTPEVRKGELTLRRTMLTMHQIGGFVTLGLMGAAVYYGQRTIDGHLDANNSHKGFVTATLVSYGLTAALAALSPPPFLRRNENSTTTIHKTLAWVHFAGMILTPIIGSMVWKNQRGPGGARIINQNDSAARFHQISAYLTTATFGAAMVVMTF
jgi:hypothetical protein